MRVLITGGAGFIGSHLVEAHLGRSDSVHVVDDLSTGSIDNLRPFLNEPGLRVDEVDVLTWGGLAEAVAGADRIYHLAAVVGMFRVLSEPVEVLAQNVGGTERLLRTVRAHGPRARLLITSSSEVYGPGQDGALREDADLVLRSGGASRWNYAVSKLAEEALALAYVRRHGLRVTVARLFNTIGRRQSGRYGMVVPRFVEQALGGRPITVHGDGSQRRCFCDVRDTVAALDRLLGVPESVGEIVNVGNDREVTILELAELVRRRAGSASPIERRAYSDAYEDGFEDVPRRRPVLDKLEALTGFRHRWALEDTLDELLAGRAAVAGAVATAPLAGGGRR